MATDTYRPFLDPVAEQAAKGRRKELYARRTCDNCGRALTPSRRVHVHVGGHSAACCSQRCGGRFILYVQAGRGSVPRQIGLATVREAAKGKGRDHE